MSEAGTPPLPRRIAATFAAPLELFRRFRAHAPWVDVLLLSTAVAVVVALITPAELLLEQMEDPVNRRGRPVEVTSEPAEIVRWGRYLAAFSALAGHPLVALALAGVLTLLFSVVGGGRATYGEYLAVAAHALLITAAGNLLYLLLHLAVGAEAPLSLAALAPADDGFARRFLELLNPFQLWMLGVLAAGVAALDGRRGWPAAAAVVYGLYLAMGAALATLPASG